MVRCYDCGNEIGNDVAQNGNDIGNNFATMLMLFFGYDLGNHLNMCCNVLDDL